MELTPKAAVTEFRERIRWMSVVVVLGMLALVTRLFVVQIVQSTQWTRIAEDNVLRRVDLPTTRGIIRDARGRVIATNRPSYNVYVIPGRFRTENFGRLAEYLGLGRDERDRLENRIRGAEGPRRYHQILARADIGREALALIETHRADLPGVQVFAVPVRQYPFGELASHAIGFLNEVNADDLAEYQDRDYRPGERIGRSGLERAWESILRGRRGWVRQEHYIGSAAAAPRNSASESIGGARRLEPVPGRDLVLSLDMELMRSVDRAFRGRPSGSAVVVDVRTGRVLALYSHPSIDPNLLITGIPPALAREIDDNPYRPRIDKTIYESYYPGSTFKPFAALAGLEAEVIDERTQVSCNGRHELGRRVWKCQHNHGIVNLRRALVESCNIYFYTLAETISMDLIARMANEFGLGHRTGIGINQETPGFIPTRAWYVQNFGQFRTGFSLNMAIGQGNTRATVLQMAMAYAALANGGTLFVPQIVERVEGPDGDVIQTFSPTLRRHVNTSAANLTRVTTALAGVVADRAGTAHNAMLSEVTIAGKTGTAQVAHLGLPAGDPRRNWYENRDHAWFAGFAPADDPQIAIVVLVEHGGSGGHEAAPVVSAIVRDWFTRIRPGIAAAAADAGVPARRP